MISKLFSRSPLGLWVGRGQQRHIVPPPPAQWGASVLLPVGQRLGQRLPLALGQQQDGQHGQQGQRGVDHVVQEVTVMVSQVDEGGAEAAHAAQGEHSTHTTAPADTAPLHVFICTTTDATVLVCGSKSQISSGITPTELNVGLAVSYCIACLPVCTFF